MIKNSDAVENYIKNIYLLLTETQEKIKPLALSKSLGVSPPAVTEMLKKLTEEGLVDHTPYQAINMTPKGVELGQNMVRRHRIWEMYLHQILGFSWDKVHQEAERLEHASSDELIDKLEELLNFPEFDPHGDPIPNKKGKMPKPKVTIPLSKCQENDRLIVTRVSDFDDEFLTYIRTIGIQLETTVVIHKIHQFDRSIEISFPPKKEHHLISEFTAQHIFVTPKKGNKS